MYKGCIFDLDGTLADTLASIAYFGNRALNDLGYKSIEVNEYRQMVGNGADKLVQRMLEKSSGDIARWKELRQIYDGYYESDPLHLVTAYPGTHKLLKELMGRNFKLSVLSNKPDNMTKKIVSALFPGILFTCVHGQTQGVPHKPDPTAAINITHEMSLKPREILYVGDSGVDMETGKNAQLDTCGVLWGFREKDELISHGAKMLARDVAELKKFITSGC